MPGRDARQPAVGVVVTSPYGLTAGAEAVWALCTVLASTLPACGLGGHGRVRTAVCGLRGRGTIKCWEQIACAQRGSVSDSEAMSVPVHSAGVALGGDRDVPSGCQVLEGQQAWAGLLLLCPWL